ncbi:DUF2336 domain-containing protein [Pararhizobium sp.]|uniref:DUF2336 domain-containing protein n=1 Tax=Pararhizobium sp. TaxID=1977563 RepID=UPI0027270D6C|nr:DUF2336 domain-containing protein [Pararhizobium sp.]MDO9417096.1 DUF2336 domain-containing protein [Pararhizobium sp.]
MIIQAFLRWVETAKASDRARAASALGRAYVASAMSTIDRQAAEMAMTFLLDDPSPAVRLALAEALGSSAAAPRPIILSLAEDQSAIAGHVIVASPVLEDADLVDLAAKGTTETRAMIALRARVSRPVCAALAEIGGETEILLLLDNDGALLSGRMIKRICERLGHCAEIRDRLFDRHDLPCDARHALVEHVGTALAGFNLVKDIVGPSRIARITREACDVATVKIAGSVEPFEIPALVEHLRVEGKLTPVFLMHALCSGKIDFFAAAIVNLSGCTEKRVRSIIADGRMHAIRALFESAGLARDISTLFVDATLMWRRQATVESGDVIASISAGLLEKFRMTESPLAASGGLLDLVEKLNIAERRQSARSYALLAATQAA